MYFAVFLTGFRAKNVILIFKKKSYTSFCEDLAEIPIVSYSLVSRELNIS